MTSSPNYSIESEYQGIVVAIDEVGRGPLAGPVMAAAAILDINRIPDGINDSKKLTAAKRQDICAALLECCRVEVGVASVEEIETHNILGATKLAMRRAYDALCVEAVVALVDGNQPPKLPCPVRTVIKGDSISLSIAAASIVAKVTRDRHMAELARHHPNYGWERNVGYSTREHLDAIRAHGVTPHHRRAFAPIRALLDDLAAREQADPNAPQLVLV